MADDSKGQEPQDGGQDPTASDTGQGTTGSQGTSDQQQLEPERFDAEYVKGLRKEAASHRTRVRELEAKLKEHEDAKLSETEKLQKRVAELEAQAQAHGEERLRYEVMLAAEKLGIVDSDAAYRLLDRDSLEDGKVEEALRKLAAAKPYLVSRSSGGSPTNPARSTTGSTDAFTAALYRGAGLTKEKPSG